MAISNLHLFPISLGVLMTATIFGSYTAAVLYENVKPIFPFISLAGSFVPQSCYFGQAFNISAVLSAIIIYIRHLQLSTRDPSFRPPLLLLNAALWSGLLSSIGVSIVGNFQLTKLINVHLLGAGLVYISGAIYFWIQTILTNYDPPHMYSKNLLIFRWIIMIIFTISDILTYYGFSIIYFQSPSDALVEDLPMSKLYLLSSISEWIMTFCIIIFVITFVRDFQYLQFIPPQVVDTKTQNISQDIKNPEKINPLLEE